MNFGTIAVIGSILAGLVSLPAVSASITGDVTAAGAKVSGVSEQDFEEAPRTVYEKVTSDSLLKTVETAFGRITFNSTPERFSAILHNPRHSLRTERGPGIREVEFVTDGMEFDILETPGKVEEICRTPRGILEKVRESGGETVRFSGSSREKVKEECTSTRSVIETQLDKVRSVSVDLGLKLPDIEVTSVNASKESVTIQNSGDNTVELDGWTISDGDNTFTGFANVTLSPGEKVTVYSDDAGDPATCEERGGPEHELCWDSSFVWNDDGETATLTNSRGETVDTHTYS